MSVKLEKTSGNLIKVDRNSSMGVAICLVAESFEKFNITWRTEKETELGISMMYCSQE